jgi:hypothetical protein
MRRLVRLAKNAALFVLGFLLLLVLRRIVLPPAAWPLERQTAPLVAERFSCSVLFVGPSYVREQIYPRVFNAEAERIGLRAHACSFGTAQLRGYELRWLLERLLSYDWPRLELVVIDITLGDTLQFHEKNWMHPRVVEWHRSDAVPWLSGYYESSLRRRPLKTIPVLWAHAKHVGARHLELGQGVAALRTFRLLDRLRMAEAGDRQPPARRRADKRPKKARPVGEKYEQEVDDLRASKRRKDRAKSDWPLELRALVRERGKEAYFLIAPVLYHRAIPSRAISGRDRLVVFDFNDPEAYPELYRAEARGRTSHLNKEGSIEYSKLLARALKSREKRPDR